ncbi:MAG: flavin reductase family protein [Synergistaceae bacterium]|nr:flavin reductase family protein [Candidatus Equadaptatus faecalis]
MKQTWKPGTLLYPLPAVLVSCGTVEKPNAMTAAWTGTICSDPVMVYVSIRPERYSYGLIEKSGEFVLNLTTEKLARATDLCGVKSGRDTDKFRLCRLTPENAAEISAPLIKESPVNIECKTEKIVPLGSHSMFIGRVLAVDVEESLLDSKGRLQLEKANLLAYSHGEYFALGRKLGTFGWTVRKK